MSVGHKLRTIDVWDTLIRRNCHPECIKLSLAQHVYLHFGDSLKDDFNNIQKLYEERLNVENHLATISRSLGNDDEYVLEVVIEKWLQNILTNISKDNSILASELAEVEFKFECERSFPDPSIGTVLAGYPAAETIFLSDFYMRSEMLSRLIDFHGIKGFSRLGVSSCDIGLNKRSGRLFSYIHKEFNISPSEHIHVGDNAHSDVAMPMQMGVASVSFLPEDGHRKREFFEKLFSNRSELFSFLQTESLSKGTAYINENSLSAESAFYAGIKAAPLFIGFSLFIAEQSLRDNVDKLFFQTREGEFFFEVYSALFPDNTLAGLTLPPASILEVSRLATFTASLRNGDVSELNRIWRLTQRQSVNALFKTLKLPIEKYLALLKQCDLSVDEVVEQPWKDSRILTLFNNEVFKSALLLKIEQDKALFARYLAEQGVSNNEKIGLVDIGWRGTIQDNVSIVSPMNFFSGYYLGLQNLLNHQPENSSKSAFGPNTNSCLDWIHLLDSIAPLEMLCNSSNGSVEGYFESASGVKSVRLIDEEENIAFEKFSKKFQEGVVFAAKVWQPYLKNYAVFSSELHLIGMKTWQALCENSSEELVEACLSSTQNDIFAFGDFFDKREIPSLGKIFRSFLFRSSRRDLIQYLKRSQWPSAILHRKDINIVHRQTILTLIYLARKFKHIRLKLLYFRAGMRSGN